MRSNAAALAFQATRAFGRPRRLRRVTAHPGLRLGTLQKIDPFCDLSDQPLKIGLLYPALDDVSNHFTTECTSAVTHVEGSLSG